jgi:hypothetical protein
MQAGTNPDLLFQVGSNPSISIKAGINPDPRIQEGIKPHLLTRAGTNPDLHTQAGINPDLRTKAGLRPRLHIQVGTIPNLCILVDIKCHLPRRLSTGTSSPKDKILIFLIKITNNRRVILRRIISNLPVNMVINGALGGRTSNLVPGITLTDRTLMDKALTALVLRGKDSGGNLELGGILVPPRIRHRCHLTLNYHF